MTKTYRQNPDIDLLFGFFGEPIPTKKEDFKPIHAVSVDENGVEVLLNDLYLKKPNKQSVLNFENKIRQMLTTTFSYFNKIMSPQHVEIFISISTNKKRFFDVDVDNLSKTVLDSLTGYVFEDDSQVVNLIAKKYIDKNDTNGILIGVTALTEKRKGLIDNVYLFREVK